MTVTKNEQTPEEKVQEEKGIAEKKQDAANALLSTLDLPETKDFKDKIEKKPEEKPEEKKPDEKPEEKKPEDEGFTREELLKIPDEELTEEGVKIKKELLEEEGDEELIPKSKVDKRFKQLTTEIKDLQRQLDKRDKEDPKDSDTARLQKMSLAELRDTKRVVKKRQLQAQKDEDEDKVDALLDLEMKIDEAITTLPQRFQQKQITLYDEVAKQIMNDDEIADIKKAAPEIKKLAEGIFSEYPKLRGIEDGMALALKLATEHYKRLQEFSIGKTRVGELKRFARSLKRKTTLDSNVLKKDKGKMGLGQAKDKAYAKGSTSLDKTDYIQQDPRFGIDQLIPDEFKGG